MTPRRGSNQQWLRIAALRSLPDMSTGPDSIRPLPPEVAKQINSSTAIPSLNCVIVGLVKNSLDAGARRLDIEVDYQRGSCTVEDDGNGIPPSEFLEDGNLAKPYCEPSCRA